MVLVAAQTAHQKKPEIPATLRPLIDTARAAPPEFFADAIIRLRDEGKIPGRDLQRELLEDAFQAAGHAKLPVLLVATPATPPDSRPIYRALGGGLKLDGLSLETRVVRATMNVDRTTARELFTRIVRPTIDAPSCENPLLEDDSAYFEMAGTIAQSTFNEEERKKDVPAQFLENMLLSVRTPFELAGFLHGIETTGLSNDQWQLIAATVASKLESMKPDYRSFAASIDSASTAALRGSIEKLGTRLESLGITTEPLARGLRAYLVAQLSAPRCADSADAGKDWIDWFNSNFRGQLPPIDEQEIAQPSKNGSAKVEIYFKSDETAHQLTQQILRLQASPSGGAISEADRTTEEWRTQFSDFIRDWAAWTPQTSSEVDAFHEKATLLRGALQLALAPDDRSKLIARAVELLRNAAVEREAAAEWLWETKEIVVAAGSDRAKLLAAFRESGDPALALFVMLAG